MRHVFCKHVSFNDRCYIAKLVEKKTIENAEDWKKTISTVSFNCKMQQNKFDQFSQSGKPRLNSAFPLLRAFFQPKYDCTYCFFLTIRVSIVRTKGFNKKPKHYL